MLTEAISRTAWELLRALEDLSVESGALLRELDEAWGAPPVIASLDPKDLVTLPPYSERPTIPA
jgi:hypothetical protein